MKLYNSATRAVEQFTVRDNTVSMYVCGVTPYDTTHTGHAFTYVMFDTLARHLAHKGHDVRYVQNVTDIDDDILRRAATLGMPWDELGRQQTAVYLRDMATLNVSTPELYVRATAEIPSMIDIARDLLAKGIAYEKNGSVYYSVASDSTFGRPLTTMDYPELLAVANERGNHPDDPNKGDPLDFVLWQKAQPDEPFWSSPWGDGRPGWHIECSAMAIRYLGSQIDIHGGGSDLLFPHHSCEIAQAEPYTGLKPFVRHWMHTAMVRQDSEKMSKSLGNMTFVRDVLGEYHPDALRLYLLQHHYRHEWDYLQDGPARATPLATRLREAVTISSGTGHMLDITVSYNHFMNAMDNDLDTPIAVTTIVQAGDSILEHAERGWSVEAAQETLREMAGVLGLWLDVTPAQA